MTDRRPHVNVGTIGHVDHGRTTLSKSVLVLGGVLLSIPGVPIEECILTEPVVIEPRPPLPTLRAMSRDGHRHPHRGKRRRHWR